MHRSGPSCRAWRGRGLKFAVFWHAQTIPETARLLLNAYVDGELDAASVIELEAQMRESPTLRQEFERLSVLQTLVQSRGRRFEAPSHLASRVFAALPEAQPVGTSKAVPGWWRPLAIGTTMAAVALLFWSIVPTLDRRG